MSSARCREQKRNKSRENSLHVTQVFHGLVAQCPSMHATPLSCLPWESGTISAQSLRCCVKVTFLPPPIIGRNTFAVRLASSESVAFTAYKIRILHNLARF